MKNDRYGRLRRALALLLALAVGFALPTLAEEALSPQADDEVLEVIEASEAEEAAVGLADAVFEAPAEPSADAAEAVTEANAVLQPNTSVPADDFEPEDYVYDVGEKSSYTLNLGDTMELCFPDGNGKSWKSSKTSVLRLSSLSDEDSVIVSAVGTGKSVLTLALTTGRVYKVTVTVVDPYVLSSLTLSKTSVTLMAGMDLDMMNYIRPVPTYAETSYTYTSSKPKVAKVSAKGIVRGLKAGAATITVTSDNGKTAKLKVTVKSNYKTLNSAPTKKDSTNQGKRWTLRPRSLQLLGDGRMVARLYVINGSAGKLKSLRNLDLAISRDTDNGENLIAHTRFSKVTVSCAKKGYAVVKLTFPAKKVYYSGIKMSSLDASKLIFRLYKTPSARTSSKTVAYRATDIPVAGSPTATDPVTYRALLVSENDFYLSHTAGNAYAWEHSTRNRNDVNLMKATLGRVKTLYGTRYQVTAQHNTSRSELKKLIQSTFADADSNDVSLFFIATHGDSADSTPNSQTGALLMASYDDTYPEYFYLSELRDQLLQVPGKVIVILESCGSGAAIYKNRSATGEAKAFDAQAVSLFRNADPGVMEGSSGSGSVASNTGELRKVNKFYVLCCSEYKEESWGVEGTDGHNFFTRWLCQGVGKSGSMPADKYYAGDKNGIVDLHELYRYIAVVGDRTPISSGGFTYYQHVQVYPSNLRFAMFK